MVIDGTQRVVGARVVPIKMPRTRELLPIILTQRDIDVLEYVGKLRGVPIEHIAELFFSADPYTQKKNKNPARACERRLRELARYNYVQFVREFDGEKRRQLVTLDNRFRGARTASGYEARQPRRRRPPVRHGAHHVKTLDALVEIRRDIEARGGAILRIQLDSDMRAHSRAGRRTRRGDEYEALPDAVLWVAMPGKEREEIAVEYVTSKYTDADIRRKHAAFAKYAKTIWVGDRQHTAERVRALTGAACSIL